jgi:hypothetical protein
MNRTSLLPLATFYLSLLLAGRAPATSAGAKPDAIVIPSDASFMENLAAHEIRRYAYLRGGELLEIKTATGALPRRGNLIVVAGAARPLAQNVVPAVQLAEMRTPSNGQSLSLTNTNQGGRQVFLVTGGSDGGVLYAAYRLAEHWGVRFYLHGDVVPDQRIKLRLPALSEVRKPLFALRGIQPFHDFPEGPDWWNREDYLAIISQLPKLGMNFFGLHTYPEGGPNAEPTVWIERFILCFPSKFSHRNPRDQGYSATTRPLPTPTHSLLAY